jgi:protein-S-isoprenylcysteine O-methyltransferase Ste14
MLSPYIFPCVVNLMVLAALPSFFFRRGRLTAGWVATAAPFILAGIGLLLGAQAPLAPAVASIVGLLSAALAAASALLVGFTLGTHQQPVSMWHQEDDMPTRLVTHGAYARIRHPFYAAFQLNLLACLAAAPNVLTLIALAAGVIQLNRTAAREEKRLLASAGGLEYRAYMETTGRFVPRTAARHAVPSPGVQ